LFGLSQIVIPTEVFNAVVTSLIVLACWQLVACGQVIFVGIRSRIGKDRRDLRG
jgi:hypothetical protein